MSRDGDSLRARIPLSPGVIAANPNLFGQSTAVHMPAPAKAQEQPAKKKASGLSKPRGRKGMNKTEQAYASRLDAMKNRRDILDFVREGVTLRWDDGLAYTPDFWVLHVDGSQELIETKGAHIRDDALVKFRAARDKWKGAFTFSMWQLKKGQWEKIL